MADFESLAAQVRPLVPLVDHAIAFVGVTPPPSWLDLKELSQGDVARTLQRADAMIDTGWTATHAQIIQIRDQSAKAVTGLFEVWHGQTPDAVAAAAGKINQNLDVLAAQCANVKAAYDDVVSARHLFLEGFIAAVVAVGIAGVAIALSTWELMSALAYYTVMAFVYAVLAAVIAVGARYEIKVRAYRAHAAAAQKVTDGCVWPTPPGPPPAPPRTRPGVKKHAPTLPRAPARPVPPAPSTNAPSSPAAPPQPLSPTPTIPTTVPGHP